MMAMLLAFCGITVTLFPNGHPSLCFDCRVQELVALNYEVRNHEMRGDRRCMDFFLNENFVRYDMAGTRLVPGIEDGDHG